MDDETLPSAPDNEPPTRRDPPTRPRSSVAVLACVAVLAGFGCGYALATWVAIAPAWLDVRGANRASWVLDTHGVVCVLVDGEAPACLRK